MKANLLCGNRNLPKGILVDSADADWIGIDRGTLILLEAGITPQFAVGDFDSITQEEKSFIEQQIEINPYNSEKDDTDLALGIDQAVQSGYKEIHVFGATGGRLDHFLGALQILEKPEYVENGIVIKLIDQSNEVQFLKQGLYHIEVNDLYPYISFIPVSYPTVITLKYFKYNLSKEMLKQGSTLTISNEINSSHGEVELIKGNVLMIRSRD
ncbi:thiamine diphosphokinase [Staphylococcus pseudoxylosus]|uniref:thiamine diphosphokinase n=1 Tax=Staphylococcus pseudoxylosus TaxID=2282419 RepID=UPI000D1F4DA5|nr:thiamine diphosphokinase [Staphylococcus pseudoxylosus]PTI81626.1 thiamine diphosphokinase [Staphylococcus xylosus]MBM2658841.1 thiamine diphosphokinase [Staphylococcus pseudoxylosus]MDW8546530.1 thiamine diphosphokinase [Staphylococcus pseudoxylosus]MEB5783178.1 thiamine diphosphokinase [Staphylococcus pseudoxylosus]MEB6332193.1 thiamine diphosphokinase [Staphylococcus pseudoxylosus]